MMSIRYLNFFFCWSLFFCLLWGRSIDSAVANKDSGSPLLVYIYTKSFHQVWSDLNTRARLDVSFWKPNDKTQTFFALGDVAQKGHGYPTKDVIMVMDRGDGLVVPPDSLTPLWTDRGSGISSNVAIYRMNARAGYTCIGHVSVPSYYYEPDKSKYRCLRNDLVIEGYPSDFAWSTQGTKITLRNSLWNVAPSQADIEGLPTGLFLVGTGESSTPSEQAYVVRYRKAVLWELAYKLPNPSIILYQTSDVDQIWTDAGSRGIYSSSIWRVKECCSLGDMATPNYSRMVGYVAKSMINGSLSKPTGFEMSWNNYKAKGSPIAIWKPTCKPEFVALGHVATPNYNMPNVEETTFRCVHSKMIDKGKWTFVWNDAKTGSKQDGSIFIAEATSSASIDISAMAAIAMYAPPPYPALVLKSSFVQMRYSKPIKSIQIVDVVYELDKKKEKIDPNAKQLSMDIQYVNTCKLRPTDSPINVKTTITYTETREVTWRHDLTVETGISVGFSADIPFVGETSVDVSLKVASTTSNEVRKSGSVSKSREASTDMKPRKKGGFYIEGRDKIYEIPWTGTVIYTFTDDTTRKEPTGGIYSDVQASEATVVSIPTENC